MDGAEHSNMLEDVMAVVHGREPRQDLIQDQAQGVVMDTHQIDRRVDGQRRSGRPTCGLEPHQNVPQIGAQIAW